MKLPALIPAYKQKQKMLSVASFVFGKNPDSSSPLHRVFVLTDTTTDTLIWLYIRSLDANEDIYFFP